MAVINGNKVELIKNDAQAKAVTLEEGKKSQRINAGVGLYLQLKISKSGTLGKYWEHPYKHDGRALWLSLGTFNPKSKAKHVSCAKARTKLAEAMVIQGEGLNPSDAKKLDKANQAKAKADALALIVKEKAEAKVDCNTFEVITRRWHKSTLPKRSPKDAAQIIRRLEKEIFPAIGSIPVAKLTRQAVMELLTDIYHSKKADGTERNDLARRIAMNVRSALNYAVDIGLIEYAPIGKLDTALPPPIHKHYPAIKTAPELGKLLRDTYNYKGTYLVCMALKLLPLVMFRNTEFRSAEWAHIDFDSMEWVIPSENRKQKTTLKADDENYHIVPLPKQAIALLGELQAVTGDCKYLFDKPVNKDGFLSENAINQALKRMGYQGVHCAHGWRATFSTMLNEMNVNEDAIEKQLAHNVKGGAVRQAYLQSNFLEQRRGIVQQWADYLDGLRSGADVIPIKRKA